LLADASVSIGVSYRIDLLFVHKTISVEVGAEFHLWGPPIGGTVHVNWYIISFTINIPPGKTTPPELDWAGFTAMLPAKPQSGSQARRLSRRALTATGADAAPPSDDPPPTPAYLTVNATAGLLRTGPVDGLTAWLVRPDQLVLSITSAIPASQVVVTSDSPSTSRTFAGQSGVGIRRVNNDISPADYQSALTATILALDEDSADPIAQIRACLATTSPCSVQPTGCTAQPIDMDGWDLEPVVSQQPAAMWGPPVSSGQPNPDPSTATVAATTGLTMTPSAPVITNCTPEMVIDQIFEDMVVNPNDQYRLPLSQTGQPAGTPPAPADSFADIANVNSSPAADNRLALFVALQALGVNGWTNQPLPEMAASPGLDFADEPLEGAPVSAPGAAPVAAPVR
jgi:hypothetical protein